MMIGELEGVRSISVIEAKRRASLANTGVQRRESPVKAGGRWPLKEEYRAGRLGATPDENRKLWIVALIYLRHWQIARGSAEGPALDWQQPVSLMALGEFMDEEAEVSEGSSVPLGYNIELNPFDLIDGVDPRHIQGNVPPTHVLTWPEQRVQSQKLMRLFKQRLGRAYPAVYRAVVKQAEMREISNPEGPPSPAVGRTMVRIGLCLIWDVLCEETIREAKLSA